MKNLFLLLILILIAANTRASEAVGSYNAGKLKEADDILEQAPSVLKLLRPRNRSFATTEMAELLEQTANEMRADFPESEPLQVGDIAARNGGKIAGHKSHQNGLDADIVYYTKKQTTQNPNLSRWSEDFVKGGKVTENFHVERNWHLMMKLIETKNVTRIFVDRAIKKVYCLQRPELEKTYGKEIVTNVLRRMRPEALHSTHMHIRINCPEKDSLCQSQPEPAKGSGCNAVLVANKPKKPIDPFNDRRGGRR